MTIEEIRKRVEEIKKNSWDDEIAHSEEDELHFEFIEFIANESAFYSRLTICIKNKRY